MHPSTHLSCRFLLKTGSQPGPLDRGAAVRLLREHLSTLKAQGNIAGWQPWQPFFCPTNPFAVWVAFPDLRSRVFAKLSW